MSRQDLNETECGICLEELYVPVNEIRGPPVEITICHHRFHRNCLQQACANNLVNCSCPTCRTRFNFNANLEDLSPMVAGRLNALDAEEAAAAQAAQAPVAGLNPQLLNYLQANYAFDRISKEFSNCFSQIIDDALAFKNDDNIGFDKQNYGVPEHLPIPEHLRHLSFGNETLILQQKRFSMHSLVGTMNEIIQKYKFNTAYSIELNNSLVILNTINQNLHDDAFINTLYQPATHPFNENIGLLSTSSSMHSPALKLVASAVNRVYQPDLYSVLNQVSPFSQELCERIIYALPVGKDHSTGGKNYLNVIPVTTIRINGQQILRPDFQFFIRCFDCFVNFIRQLVAINFNVAQQLGGRKSRKSIKSIKGRKK
jgi:hypothetical protein